MRRIVIKWLKNLFCQLSMQSDNLEANIGAVVEAVCKHRPLSLGNLKFTYLIPNCFQKFILHPYFSGSFISIALLFCPPTREKFAIDISKYVPVSPRVADDEDADAIKQ